MGTQLRLEPVDASFSLKEHIYRVLKDSIMDLDIYDPETSLRMDERRLAESLGISRTPVREALMRLEQEGFVETRARRGVYIRRKSLAEILEMITVWAALESMAARLACTEATDAEIAELRRIGASYTTDEATAHIQEYSDANIAFHQTIIRLGGCKLIADMTENLFIHMRAIRKVTIRQDNRAARSIVDHTNIIEALAARDGERAERLVREHTFGLRAHVEKHGEFLA